MVPAGAQVNFLSHSMGGVESVSWIHRNSNQRDGFRENEEQTSKFGEIKEVFFFHPIWLWNPEVSDRQGLSFIYYIAIGQNRAVV